MKARNVSWIRGWYVLVIPSSCGLELEELHSLPMRLIVNRAILPHILTRPPVRWHHPAIGLIPIPIGVLPWDDRSRNRRISLSFQSIEERLRFRGLGDLALRTWSPRSYFKNWTKYIVIVLNGDGKACTQRRLNRGGAHLDPRRASRGPHTLPMARWCRCRGGTTPLNLSADLGAIKSKSITNHLRKDGLGTGGPLCNLDGSKLWTYPQFTRHT